MQLDAAQATIITDRCTPPKGLGSSPSTIKAVLWCLRGLGAPGTDLRVPSAIIERRTCLSSRAVRSAMSTLREFGILNQLEAPAPGRATRYSMDYLQLSEWLDDGDRDAARLLHSQSNGGTTRHRTEAPNATDRRQHTPPITPTVAAHSATVAAHSATAAPHATDMKEETAIPAIPAAAAAETDADQLLAAAAAGGFIYSIEDWTKIGKQAGLEIGIAGQAGHALIDLGVIERSIGLNALERLRERVQGGGVTNPVGLLRSIVQRPGGAEPSAKSLSRNRGQIKRRAEFVEFLRANPQRDGLIEERTSAILEAELGFEAKAKLMPFDRFRDRLLEWPTMLDFMETRWETIRTMNTVTQ